MKTFFLSLFISIGYQFVANCLKVRMKMNDGDFRVFY